MDKQKDIARTIAYWIAFVGCTLALVTAFAPMPSGAYKLSFGFLILGITPYFVYVCLTELLKCCSLITGGIILLVADLIARFGFLVINKADTNLIPAFYLCFALTLIVIPVGVLLGRLVSTK